MHKLGELASGAFLEHAENALVFGLPGVGKSHAACAIGNAGVLKNFVCEPLVVTDCCLTPQSSYATA
jgi:DNA replication protein DnaC